MRPLRRIVALLVVGAVATLAACANSSGSPASQVTVLAAASLTEVFTAIGANFERAHPGVRVTFSFAASSTLANQIVQGAPADVFASASPATMETVTDAGAGTGNAKVFARNQLVIAVAPGNPRGITGLADLARSGIKVALCAQQVPCGAAAARVLNSAGVRLTPVTREQDVKSALAKVSLGEVDAALVYRTDVRAAKSAVDGVEFAESASGINDYLIVALKESSNPPAAQEFVAFVLSTAGAAELARAGFRLADGSS